MKPTSITISLEEQIAALKKANEKLSLATQVAGIGVWEYCLSDKKFKADATCFTLYGSAATDVHISFEKWMEFVHDEDRQRVYKEILTAFQQHTDFNLECRIIWSDGTIHYIKSIALIQRDETGYPTCFLGTTFDITKQVLAEQAIRQSEAKYRSFFENSMDGLLLSETDGNIIAANPAACNIFRMTEEEIRTTGRMGLVDLSDPQVTTMLLERQRTGKAKGAITYKRKDGSTFPGELTSVAYTDDNGNERTSMIIRDVTASHIASQEILATSQALHHAMKDLNRFMDSSMDIICTINERGEFVNVSSAATEILGYELSEITGQPFMKFVVDEDICKTEQISIKIRNGLQVNMFENRYKCKNGNTAPLLWSARWDDEYGLMYCIARDASEKRKLENAFEYQQQHFYDLFHSAPFAIAVLRGPDHEFEMANPNYLQLIGRKDIIGKPVSLVLPEIMTMQGYQEILNKVYQTGTAYYANETMVQINRDGNNKLTDTYLNFKFLPNRNADGMIEGVFIFANEITEQVMSRKRISFHTANLQAILNTTDTGYVLVDRNLNIISYNRIANERIVSICNRPLEENHCYLDYFDAAHSKFKQEKIIEVLQGKRVEITFEQQMLNGSTRWYSVKMSPILMENHIDGICFASSDITALKEAELEKQQMTADLLQRYKDLEQFNYIVSHNLRAHVANISGICNLLNDGGTDTETQKLFWDKLCDSVEMLDTVLKDLNSILEIQKEVKEFSDEVHLPQLLSGVIKSISCNLKTSGAVIKSDFTGAESLTTFKSYMFSIFYNLITNSIKYKRPDEPPRIYISSKREGTKTKITFTDNGLGIDLNRRGDQIFKLYKRFHQHVEGKGIGLFMTKTQVESLGGKLSIDSVVNQGTTITIIL